MKWSLDSVKGFRTITVKISGFFKEVAETMAWVAGAESVLGVLEEVIS